jgi:hypothetical protein
MKRLVLCTSIAASILAGCGAAAPSAAPTRGTATTAPVATLGATSSPTRALGGTVRFSMDGAPATTEVDVVADGASVSGTVVTTLSRGAHTVRLECAAGDGDFWVLGGTVEESTVEAGSAGAWSAVIVKEGSPQQIGIWISDPKSGGIDCDDWLGSIDPAEIGPENFHPVESGVLVSPA